MDQKAVMDQKVVMDQKAADEDNPTKGKRKEVVLFKKLCLLKQTDSFKRVVTHN
jgi:hypothetical protein